MVIDNLLSGLIGAVIVGLAIYYLEERSKHHSYELDNIYKPLREEFAGVSQTGIGRLDFGDRYPWSQSDEYRKIQKRGDLLPPTFRNLRSDIIELEEMNKTLGEKSSELWNAAETALDGALAVIPNGLRQILKDQLFKAVYFGQEDRALQWLDMQRDDWKYHSQIPTVKAQLPEIRLKAEGEIAGKRAEFMNIRYRFLDVLNLVLKGIERSIESGGRKKYRRRKH
jgi:hypothetical protein